MKLGQRVEERKTKIETVAEQKPSTKISKRRRDENGISKAWVKLVLMISRENKVILRYRPEDL